MEPERKVSFLSWENFSVNYIPLYYKLQGEVMDRIHLIWWKISPNHLQNLYCQKSATDKNRGVRMSSLVFFICKNQNLFLVIGFYIPGLISYLPISQGWTLYEVLRYAPEHNWVAYEEALKTNPVLAKMAISGAVYSIGDWIAQVCVFFKEFIFNDSSWWPT